MANKRIVITGTGVVTPLGCNVEEMWRRLMNCESGIGPTTVFDASTFPSQFSAQVPDDYDHLADLPQELREEHKLAGRNSRFMIGAAVQAWRQAMLPLPLNGDEPAIRSERVGLYLGAGEGPLDFDNFIAPTVEGWNSETQEMNWEIWGKVAKARMDAIRELEQEPNMPGSHLARLFRITGPCMSCLTACAASTQATGEALEMIRCGDADIVIAGGCHSMIHPLGVTGFNRLTALSTRNDDPTHASRPFDKERDGFVLAEGAGAVILEDLESARKRNAPILAEVLGYGSTADAFRVTDQHEDGRGGIAAVQLALKDAGVSINDIDYISSHGTGTAENDSIETHVIKSVFGDQAYKVPVSSVKSMLGHLIAAAGVVELITCVLAIRDQILPPTTNLTNLDPECDLDYVPNQPRKAPVNIAMSNSFGFGGQNNIIIIKKFSE
ncbi:MAG: beta-ketoacyl-[acyl-carrier-protein] synthase family protein [Sedimentisphaerales bacterium]|nr:beta-ketoacyl-[acyl-carrier-protein] synthase family protein [Sedimentisphaerales bacterium]